jgi:hypothetical protein
MMAASEPVSQKTPTVLTSASGDEGPSVLVHIASYRNQASAEKGWQILRSGHGDLLSGLGHEVREIDFGTGMGIYYRLQAGPVTNETAAKKLCRALKDRGLYCAIAYF